MLMPRNAKKFAIDGNQTCNQGFQGHLLYPTGCEGFLLGLRIVVHRFFNKITKQCAFTDFFTTML